MGESLLQETDEDFIAVPVNMFFKKVKHNI